VGPKRKVLLVYLKLFSVSSRLMTIAPAFFFQLDLGLRSIFLSSGGICWKSVHRTPEYHGWKTWTTKIGV